MIVCPFCGKELPEAHSACCGEVGHGVEVCPKCGGIDTGKAHAEPTAAYPETTYSFCYDCNEQWGHE